MYPFVKMAVADVACLQDVETEADSYSDSCDADGDVQIFNEYDEYILRTFGRHLLRHRRHRRNKSKRGGQDQLEDDRCSFAHYEVAKVSGTVEPDLQYLHPPYDVGGASAKFTLKAAADGLSSVVYKLRYFKNDAVKISLVPHDVTGVIHPGQEKVFT